MQYGWAAPSLPQLLSKDSHIPTTSSDGAWVAAMSVLGNIPGSLIGGYIVDKIGRKYTILLTSPIYFTTWLIIAFARSLWVLNAGRLCAGMADGLIFTAFPMYMGEISHPNIRGLLGSFIQVSMVLGSLLINIVGSHFNIEHTALIMSIVPVLHFITFCWMPESPYFLLMTDQGELARKSLQKLHNTEDVTKELIRVEDAVSKGKNANGKFWHLFTVPSNRKAMYIVFGLRCIQQLCGITAIMFYVKIIFKEAKTDISATMSTIIYFTIQLVLSIVSSALVDKAGRKPLLLMSIVGSAIMLALEGIYFYVEKETTLDTSSVTYLPLIAMLGFCIAFNFGMGTIPTLFLGEFFPTDVKAFALCLIDIFACFLAALTSKCFQFMNDHFGLYSPFFFFTSCCILGLVFILLIVPETKGKTLEDIQRELKGERNDVA